MKPIRLTLGDKLSYAAGSALDGIVNQSLNIFLLFYLTAVCGLPGGLAGAALAAGLVVDAVVDPLIGSASDGWRSRLGRRLPFMMVGLPLAAIAFIAIFSLPRGLGTAGLFAWVTVLSILLRASSSLFLLPYNAVGAEISSDYDERSSIVSWRWGIAMLGTVASILIGFGGFFAGAGGTIRRSAYIPFAVTLALIFVIGGLFTIRFMLRTSLTGSAAQVSERPSLSRLRHELVEVFRNRSFVVLFASAVTCFCALGTHATLGLHANTFFWRFSTAQTQMVTLALFGGLLVGAPASGLLLKRLEKRSALLLGLVGLSFSQGLPVILRLVGLFPAGGPQLMWTLSGIVFLGGILTASAAIALASMIADAADEHELLFGSRREGLYFAGWAFASKAAAGGGSLIAGCVLQLIAFPSGLAQSGRAAVKLPDHMVNLLAIFYGPGAGVLYLASAAITLFYRLDAKAHRAIIDTLQIRRSAADGQPQEQIA